MLNIKRFQSLPPEVLSNVICHLDQFQIDFIYQQYPDLRKIRLKHGIVLTIIKRGQKELCKEFLQYSDDRERFFIYLPEDTDLNNIMFEESEFVYQQIENISILQENYSFENLVIEFAFDLDSESCYEAMNLYPLIHPAFLNIPHTVLIFKNERPLHEFAKSKNHDLRFFDRTLRGTQPYIRGRYRYDTLILNFPTPSFRTFYDENNQVRSTFFFNDINFKDKIVLTSHESPLLSISVVIPNTMFRLDKESHMITSLRSATISSIRKNLEDHFYEMEFQETRNNIALNRFPFQTPFNADQRIAQPIVPEDFRNFENNEMFFDIGDLRDQDISLSNKIYLHYNYSTKENLPVDEHDRIVESVDMELQDHVPLCDSLLNMELFEFSCYLKKIKFQDLQQRYITVQVFDKGWSFGLEDATPEYNYDQDLLELFKRFDMLALDFQSNL